MMFLLLKVAVGNRLSSWQVKAIDFQDLWSIPCVTCSNQSWCLYLLELELFLSFYQKKHCSCPKACACTEAKRGTLPSLKNSRPRGHFEFQWVWSKICIALYASNFSLEKVNDSHGGCPSSRFFFIPGVIRGWCLFFGDCPATISWLYQARCTTAYVNHQSTSVSYLSSQEKWSLRGTSWWLLSNFCPVM